MYGLLRIIYQLRVINLIDFLTGCGGARSTSRHLGCRACCKSERTFESCHPDDLSSKIVFLTYLYNKYKKYVIKMIFNEFTNDELIEIFNNSNSKKTMSNY